MNKSIMAHEVEIESYYLYQFLDPKSMAKCVKEAVNGLKGIKFDAIAFRGISGALTAPVIAYKMKKTLLAVRKERGSHSALLVEGDKNAKRYIIVDDFCVSGGTVRSIVENVRKLAPHAEFVGMWGMKYEEWIEPTDYRFDLRSLPKMPETSPEPIEIFVPQYFNINL